MYSLNGVLFHTGVPLQISFMNTWSAVFLLPSSGLVKGNVSRHAIEREKIQKAGLGRAGAGEGNSSSVST